MYSLVCLYFGQPAVYMIYGGFQGSFLLSSVFYSFLQVPFTFCRDICQEKGLFVFGLAEKKFAGAQKCT